MRKYKNIVYVGGYTNDVSEYNRYSKGKGLAVYGIKEDGEWDKIQELEDDNPCVLGFGKNKAVVYAANSPTEGKEVVGITCYEVQGENATLKKSDRQLNLSFPVCNFAVHPDFGHLTCVDFQGNIYLISLNGDGTLRRVEDKKQLSGKTGPLAGIQKCPRPHSVNISPDGQYIFLPDKGCDCVHICRQEGERLSDILLTEYLRPASCPRHMAFHPNGKIVYVLNEFSNTIYGMKFDEQAMRLAAFQIIPTEPSDSVSLYAKAAEIEIDPKGRHLYASNRGHNSIAVYDIDDNGVLRTHGWYSTGGEIPRFFTMDKQGKYIICGNQKSHSISIFSIKADGGLELMSVKANINCPTWILLQNDNWKF